MSNGKPVAPVATPKEGEENFNAGDPEQVRQRTERAKRRENIRHEGLRFVMADRRGRAWVHHLLTEKLFMQVGKGTAPGFFTGNSTTFYNAALAELGAKLQRELKTLCGPEFRLMEDEGDT